MRVLLLALLGALILTAPAAAADSLFGPPDTVPAGNYNLAPGAPGQLFGGGGAGDTDVAYAVRDAAGTWDTKHYAMPSSITYDFGDPPFVFEDAYYNPGAGTTGPNGTVLALMHENSNTVSLGGIQLVRRSAGGQWSPPESLYRPKGWGAHTPGSALVDIDAGGEETVLFTREAIYEQRGEYDSSYSQQTIVSRIGGVETELFHRERADITLVGLQHGVDGTSVALWRVVDGTTNLREQWVAVRRSGEAWGTPVRIDHFLPGDAAPGLDWGTSRSLSASGDGGVAVAVQATDLASTHVRFATAGQLGPERSVPGDGLAIGSGEDGVLLRGSDQEVVDVAPDGTTAAFAPPPDAPEIFAVTTDRVGDTVLNWQADNGAQMVAMRPRGGDWRPTETYPRQAFFLVDDAALVTAISFPCTESECHQEIRQAQLPVADVCALPDEDGGEFTDTVPPGGTVTTPTPADDDARARGAARAAALVADDTVPTKGKIVYGPIQAVGCFAPVKDKPGHYTNNSPTVRVNGIDVVADTHTLDFDANLWRMRTTEPVTFKVGGQTVWKGTYDRQFKRTTQTFAKSGATGLKFKGLALDGAVELKFEPGKATLSLTGEIPVEKTLKFGTAGGAGKLEFSAETSNDKGLRLTSIKGTLPSVTLGSFGFQDLAAAFDPSEGKWELSGQVNLPFPRANEVAGKAVIKNGHLTGFEISLNPFNQPVGQGIFLQTLSFSADGGEDDSSFTVGGGIGLSVGPQVTLPDGSVFEAVRANGKLSYAFPAPGTWKLTGDLAMVNQKLASGEITVTGDGKVDFNGLLTLNGRVGPLSVYNAEGKLIGFTQGSSAFQAQGAVHDVRFLGWTFSDAQAIASSKGLGVCTGTAGHRIGFGYDWRTFSAIDEKCDVGRWATVRKARSARAASDSAQVTVGSGETMLVLSGAADGGAPRLSLSGPGGVLSPNADGVLQSDRGLIGRDDENRSYVVLFDPPAGTYTLSSDKPLTDVRAADSTAGAEGGVTGVPVPVTTAAPTASPAVAATASPTASPKPTRLRAPGKLKAKRRGKKLTLTWKKVAGAARYRVVVKRGRKKIARTVKKPVLTLKVPRGKLTVTVSAVAASGAQGPAASRRVR